MDAYFTVLWKHEYGQDPVCVKSRTGYVMTLGVCPLHWVSKIQTEMSLSTLESEYTALSQAMRDLLPLRLIRLIQDIGTQFKMDFASPAIMYSTAFEDNNGALGLATPTRTNPRTRHISTKYHFFREHVGKGKGIMLHRVESKKH